MECTRVDSSEGRLDMAMSRGGEGTAGHRRGAGPEGSGCGGFHQRHGTRDGGDGCPCCWGRVFRGEEMWASHEKFLHLVKGEDVYGLVWVTRGRGGTLEARRYGADE